MLDNHSLMMNIANAAANKVYGAVVAGTAGIGAGVIVGGSMGYQKGKSNDHCTDGQFLYTIGGAIAGGVIGSSGAALGAAVGLDGVIDIAKTPFVSVFNSINLATNLASKAASTIVNSATDLSFQHPVATMAVATGAVALTAYATSSEEQKNHLIGYAKSFLRPKDLSRPTTESGEMATRILNEKRGYKLKKEELKLEESAEQLKYLLGSTIESDEIAARIIDKYRGIGEINIRDILELRDNSKSKTEHLSDEKLNEIIKVSLNLIESATKCVYFQEKIKSGASL